MTQRTYPFGDGAVDDTSKTMNEEQWAAAFRYLLGTGVIAVAFQDALNQIQVTPGTNALTLDVDTGAAFIQGHLWESDAHESLSLAINPATSDGWRSDLVVLRCKWGRDAGISLQVIQGTPGLQWPSSDPRSNLPVNAQWPQPTQEYGVAWEIPLAAVNVPSQNQAPTFTSGNVIDQRDFVASGGAKTVTFVLAAADASSLMRANADDTVAEGSLNAEQAINSAILAVSAVGGGTVQLSEGHFQISRSILCASNVNLRGMGSQTIIQCQASMGSYTPSTSANTGAAGTHAAIVCDNLTSVTISDLAINGGGVAPTLGTMPTVAAGYEGIAIYNGILNAVLDCQVNYMKASGIGMWSNQSSRTDSYGHKVERCYIGNCSAVGIFIESNGSVITNNQVDLCGTGMQLNSSGSSGVGGYGASINLVASNNVRWSMGNGIVLYSASAGSNCTQNVITSNIVSNSGQANPSGDQNNSGYANISVTGAVMPQANTAGTQQNLISDNHLQAWTDRQPKYSLWIDGNNNYNFYTGNFLYSGGYIACNGHGAACNRLFNNFGYADYTTFTNC